MQRQYAENNFDRPFLLCRLRSSDGVGIASEKAIQGNNASSRDGVDKVLCDASGNLFMYGQFTAWCGIPTDSVYANGTAASPDYFILKWGLECTDSLNSLDKPQESPTNLVANATGMQSIAVTWSNNTPYRAGFNLYRSSPDSIGAWSLINTTGDHTYSYTDTNVVPNTIYWYKITAYTAGGESDFSNIDSAVIVATTVEDNFEGNSILIYPNPADKEVRIVLEAQDDFNAEVLITDMLGNVLTQQTRRFTQGGNFLNFSCEGWQSGVYVVNIKSASGRWSGRILKY